MGTIVMVCALAYFWFTHAKRAMYCVAGIMVFGPAAFLLTTGGVGCAERAWFCGIDISPVIVTRSPPNCPHDGVPVSTRIFTEAHVDAEVHRLISTGVCQTEAIARIHAGWGAKFAPEYQSLYGTLVP